MEHKQIRTGEFRCSYPYLLTPSEKGGQYSVQAIFEKDDPSLKELRKFVQEAIEEKWPDENDRPFVATPFKPGVKKSEETPKGYDPLPAEYAGKVIVPLKSYSQPPGVVDAACNDLLAMNPQDKVKIYGGMYGRATVKTYIYAPKNGGTWGVSLVLQNFQKTRDGERFGGGRRNSPTDDFEPMAVGANSNNDDLLDI